MPGYDDHRRLAEMVAPVGASVAGLLVWFVTSDARLAFTGACVEYIAITIGAPLPDLDSPPSVPRRRLTRLLQFGTALAVMVVGVTHWSRVVAFVVLIPGLEFADPVSNLFAGIWILLTTVLVVLVTPAAFSRLLPRHRGPLHDIRFWLVVIGGPVVVVYLLDLPVLGSRSAFRDVVVWTAATGFLLGVSTHLAADDTIV